MEIITIARQEKLKSDQLVIEWKKNRFSDDE